MLISNTYGRFETSVICLLLLIYQSINFGFGFINRDRVIKFLSASKQRIHIRSLIKGISKNESNQDNEDADMEEIKEVEKVFEKYVWLYSFDVFFEYLIFVGIWIVLIFNIL